MPTPDSRPTAVDARTAPPEGSLIHVDLELLDENPFQPRTEMDPAKLAELAASIAATGLLQPIAVRPAGGGRYQIVAGHRRAAAFRQLKGAATTDDDRRKYRLIPATVRRNFDDPQMAIGAFVENVSRADLNPFEEAAALVRIRDLVGASNAKALASLVSQNEHRVRRLLRLYEAPEVVKAAVTTGLLVDVEAGTSSERDPRRERRRLDLIAALEFAKLHDHVVVKAPKDADPRVANAIRRALTDNWGFRRTQEFVAAAIAGRTLDLSPPSKEAPNSDSPPAPILERMRDRLTVHLSRLDRASPDDLVGLANELRQILSELEARISKPASNVA